jgi:hypothetical protein
MKHKSLGALQKVKEGWEKHTGESEEAQKR